VTATLAARAALHRSANGSRLDAEEVLALEHAPADGRLFEIAAALTLEGHGRSVGYSRKVFIPLTHLCRDVCHYCTFAHPPRRGEPAFLSPEQVLDIARAGQQAGCHEALFTLGDKPELRYRAARMALASLGFSSTLEYVGHVARLVFEQTGLLPHLNPGAMTAADLAGLRPAAVSMGLMLESSARRLAERGGPHFGSPDKTPAARLDTLRNAGEQRIAMTSGLLIGIGETRREHLESLLALRDLGDRHGHIQEVIIQNLRVKPGTRMENHPEPAMSEHAWTIAVARLVLGATTSIQAPPNLRPSELPALVAAGANDWGGISPVTPDHVNPEAPWPEIERLAAATAAAGRQLAERLALVPSFAIRPETWAVPDIACAVRQRTDARGFVRREDWSAGSPVFEPPKMVMRSGNRGAAQRLVDRALSAADWSEAQVCALFAADGQDLPVVLEAANRVREATVGGLVTCVVNRNINYTNICTYRCGFCAFAKGRSARSLRGPAYRLDATEIAQLACEAVERGATEVCLQGGIHPEFTGHTYLEIVRAVRHAAPSLHIHAFSPLEIWHGASTLQLSLAEYLGELKRAGLATLPGTAAEILDDEVRRVICPDKLTTAQWLEVMRVAHATGLRSTATIMFGHVDDARHWARHLLQLRQLQAETAGFTEFVPLPFVHMESPLYRRGGARPGPTFRETLLMHAVARLVLHPYFVNIQASWVKLGPAGAGLALNAGANDLGGTLMNESITRAAGGAHGQELGIAQLSEIAARCGRPLGQRTTLYAPLDTSFLAPAKPMLRPAAGPCT